MSMTEVSILIHIRMITRMVQNIMTTIITSITTMIIPWRTRSR
jgi:hypothetical protein